ncbi:Hypothetical predicted protein [Cloeon dipterum]|uniref:DNA polymerase eta n=1 Tax=Cloeon dipterum TaxID=197152 RepID=A0A8S1C1F2_9INSE|nr:Hypothetical predicted protein [Cloeon dipterum]
MRERIVALVDMDCFFCQVEQRINPELKGKPVAVVQYNKWRGGGIIAVNYEARACGVTRHMRGDEAKEKCPEINLVHVPSINDKADTSRYREAGKEVINVICQFNCAVQRASVDEAFLDLTEAVDKRIGGETQVSADHLPSTHVVGFESQLENKEEGRSEAVQEWLRKSDASSEDDHDYRLVVAAKMVEEMRKAIFTQTGFTCSAGIAHNKILSKLVCGMHKPNQQTVLPISKVPFLYETLPVKKVRLLGGKLGDTLMEKLGINYMSELEKFSEAELCQKFEQRNGQWLYNIARGIDNEEVEARLIPKSIGCCKRFPGKTALKTKQELEHWIQELAVEVCARLDKDYEENCRRPRNLVVQWSVEVGSSNSKTGFLSHFDQPSLARDAMILLCKSISIENSKVKVPIQFLGLSVGKFTEERNKANSIAKFFKPSSASETKVNETIVSDPPVPEVKQEAPPIKTGPMSFFLRNLKKKDPEKNDARVAAPQTSVESDEDEKESVKSDSDKDVETDKRCQGEEEAEAPCPQCGKSVKILDMSEHLDHHVAQELHKELNQPVTPVIPPQPSTSALPKKRKYTKSKTQSAGGDAKKIRSIQSFFNKK